MATTYVQAACVLHNFLLQDADRDPFVQYMEVKSQTALKEAWDLNVSGLQGVPRIHGYHSGMEPHAVRNIFAMYFTSKEGHIPWKDEYACVQDLLHDETAPMQWQQKSVSIL